MNRLAIFTLGAFNPALLCIGRMGKIQIPADMPQSAYGDEFNLFAALVALGGNGFNCKSHDSIFILSGLACQALIGSGTLALHGLLLSFGTLDAYGSLAPFGTIG
jgi:hypothetical protein